MKLTILASVLILASLLAALGLVIAEELRSLKARARRRRQSMNTARPLNVVRLPRPPQNRFNTGRVEEDPPRRPPVTPDWNDVA